MLKQILFITAMFMSFEASATGGFSCDYDKDGVKLQLGGVTSHGFGSAIVDAEGVLTVKGKNGAAGSRRFVRDDYRQYWNMNNEFRLVLYAESDVGNTVSSDEVTIITQGDDNGNFTGTMRVQHYGPDGDWSVRGLPVTCSVE